MSVYARSLRLAGADRGIVVLMTVNRLSKLSSAHASMNRPPSAAGAARSGRPSRWHPLHSAAYTAAPRVAWADV
jgi:hypothetical protein